MLFTFSAISDSADRPLLETYRTWLSGHYIPLVFFRAPWFFFRLLHLHAFSAQSIYFGVLGVQSPAWFSSLFMLCLGNLIQSHHFQCYLYVNNFQIFTYIPALSMNYRLVYPTACLLPQIGCQMSISNLTSPELNT